MSKHNFSLEERVEIIERFLSSIGPFEGFKAEPEIFPAKRTIKGGWVNVYRYSRAPTIHISPIIFRTRQECDTEGVAHRIACIQIPYITEGEGL